MDDVDVVGPVGRAVVTDEPLREGDNGFPVEQAQVGLAHLEHPLPQLSFGLGLVSIAQQRVEISLELVDEVIRQHILDNEEPVLVELIDPVLDRRIPVQPPGSFPY